MVFGKDLEMNEYMVEKSVYVFRRINFYFAEKSHETFYAWCYDKLTLKQFWNGKNGKIKRFVLIQIPVVLTELARFAKLVEEVLKEQEVIVNMVYSKSGNRVCFKCEEMGHTHATTQKTSKMIQLRTS